MAAAVNPSDARREEKGKRRKAEENRLAVFGEEEGKVIRRKWRMVWWKQWKQNELIVMGEAERRGSESTRKSGWPGRD